MTTSVFRAVADPHRRHLLDALRAQDDLTLGGLCAELPISRQAVSKHLAVLEDAGLVRVRTHGRERLHRLDPEPLGELAAWVTTYADFWSDRLDALEVRLGEPSRDPAAAAPAHRDGPDSGA